MADKKKKASDNWLLNKVRKNQLNPKNKSKSSTFIKRQQALNDAINDVNSY